MNPIQRFINRWLQPTITDAYQRGQQDGHQTGFLEAWQASSVFDTGTADTDLGKTSSGTRNAYERHALFTAAADTLVSLVLGTGVTYGTLDDPKAQAALEEWYALNDIENLSKAMFLTWLLDGELLALIAQDASRNEPAWVNLWDPVAHPVTVNTERGNPRLVTGIKLDKRTAQPSEFAWRANTIGLNKVRGKSPLTPAVQAAEDYTRLMALRMRAHEIRGRLNAVYHAMARDGAELARKAERYRTLPRDGNVVTLQMDPGTGQSERLEFTNPDTRASDAESDIRMIVRTVAMMFGIPEHYLANGDTSNRATADAMAEPMMRRVEEHQTFLEGFLAELFQKELIRRFGPDATFTVNTSELQRDGTRVDGTIQVPATELHIPFSFPSVRTDEGHDLERVRFAVERGLISHETAVEALGFDPALELERAASAASGEPGGDFSEDTVNQQRILNASRLADEANKADPTVGLHWAHILTAEGAATAPGAYLQAAIPKTADGERLDLGSELELSPVGGGDNAET